MFIADMLVARRLVARFQPHMLGPGLASYYGKLARTVWMNRPSMHDTAFVDFMACSFDCVNILAFLLTVEHRVSVLGVATGHEKEHM